MIGCSRACRRGRRARQLPRPAGQSGFVIGLLLVLLALASLVVWMVGTTSGAALALRLGMTLTGSGQAQGVQGSLFDGLRVTRLEYRSETVEVRGSGLELVVDWPALRQRVLRVQTLAASDLHVELHADTEAPAAEADDDGPLTWPDLPVSIEAKDIRVGHFSMVQNGSALPVELAGLDAAFTADAQGAQLTLASLQVTGPDADAAVRGQVRLGGPEPWAVDARLNLDARQNERAAAFQLSAQGSFESLAFALQGSGEGMEVDIRADLAPASATLPLRSLHARVKGFEPAAWLNGAPPALLNVTADVQLEGGIAPAPDPNPAAPTDAFDEWMARIEPLDANLKVSLDEGSRWHGQPLRATVDARVDDARIDGLNAQATVGKNVLSLKGAWGAPSDELAFNLKLPQPAALWPGLEGSANLSGTLQGMPDKHALNVAGTVDLPFLRGSPSTARLETVAPGEQQVVEPDAVDLPAVIRQGPISFAVTLQGAWAPGQAGQLAEGRMGWRGTLGKLDVKNPSVGLGLAAPAAVAVAPAAGEVPLQWSVGKTAMRVKLPDRRSFTLVHEASSGSGAHWRSAGSIENLTPAWLIAQLPRSKNPLRVDLAWDLALDRALAGTVDLRRRAGDLVLPGDSPMPVGLETLRLHVRATPANGSASKLVFEADVAGKTLGSVSATGSTVVNVRGGVPEITEQQPIDIQARLAVKDIGWVSVFVGDATDVGGAIDGSMRFVRTNGEWNASGSIEGSGLRVVRIDDGIRLLDGTLKARFIDGSVLVDSLRFPAVIRSAPRNSRVQAWLAEHGDSGFIQASGEWTLASASGKATVELSRFPVVQRADRFIAGSGTVNIEASPTRMNITGKVVADAGWISLEGAETLPSLASDVVIVRAGEQPQPNGESLRLRLNLDIDLGKNVYLSGMGLQTGLEGSINIRNTTAGLRARGVVNTREGRFSIYGQTLVVRRGNVTFEGMLDDPLLDIVAVRQGLQIEAGVQVSGTARRPVITLVSFPDVPEVEKLSWLLLGRGPDASGADAGMLLAAAASLLGDDESEPIYRQLGLDELGLRSGMAGSVRGLLPERTVVGDIKRLGESDAATQFLVVGKRLTDALYLTFEQALSGRETVVRASYRISDRLSASVQGGTINGLQLVWSLVFDD